MGLQTEQPMPAMPSMLAMPTTVPSIQIPSIMAPSAASTTKPTNEEIATAILATTTDEGLKQVVAQPKPWYAIFSSSASTKLVKAANAYKEFAAKHLRGEIGTGEKAEKAAQAADEALVKSLRPIVLELAPEEQEAALQTLVDAARNHGISEAKQERTALIDKEGGMIVKNNQALIDKLAKAKATGNAAEAQKAEAMLTAKVTEATKKIKGITPEEIQQEVAKITSVTPEQAKAIAEANKTQAEKLMTEVGSQAQAAVAGIPGALMNDIKTSMTAGMPAGASTALSLAGKLTGGRV